MGRLRAKITGVWWRDQFRQIRHCYRCGQALERRYVEAEGTRRQVCVGCGTITYLNPKVVAGLIPSTADGRIALLQRDNEPARGYWTYPAGFQEMGESVADAAAREALEEIESKVSVDGLVGIYSYIDAGVVTIVYSGRIKGKAAPAPGREAQAVQLFWPSEIPWKKLAFRSTADALMDWLKANGHRAPRRRLKV